MRLNRPFEDDWWPVRLPARNQPANGILWLGYLTSTYSYPNHACWERLPLGQLSYRLGLDIPRSGDVKWKSNVREYNQPTSEGSLVQKRKGGEECTLHQEVGLDGKKAVDKENRHATKGSKANSIERCRSRGISESESSLSDLGLSRTCLRLGFRLKRC